ncbi:MAG: hypothetical protein PHD95_07155 [Candidatus ainarchaeum sp.]|nr:hypothetical protein [Candidatus ainarchaeum sp.]
MKKIFAILGLFLVFLFANVFADITVPTTTTVYFEKDNLPYNAPVDFTISCYGYNWQSGPDPVKEPGTYTPEKVFGFSASCPEYGCKIQEHYYLNYRHIDYCDLAGTTQGKEFKIEKYASSPIDFEKCQNTGTGSEFGRVCSVKFTVPADIPNPNPEPNPNPNPEPGPRNFFEMIICFFKSLFGQNC